MEATGERYLPEMQGVIEIEHLSRYYFVHQLIDLSNKIVVDLASGEGYGSKILSEKALKVTGIDLSSEAINYANQKYSNSHNLNFIEGNAVKIPLDDQSVDVFVSFETIEHHDQHEKMLSEIKRVLKPDGILIMSSPDKLYYTDIPNYQNEYHIKELYYGEFKKLLKNYFTFNEYYFQRVFTGALITIDNENCTNKLPFVQRENEPCVHFQPLYNLVISSDYEYSTSHIPHFLYGETENILTGIDIENAKKEIIYSVEYLVGMKILKRFKFLRKYFIKKWRL